MDRQTRQSRFEAMLCGIVFNPYYSNIDVYILCYYTVTRVLSTCMRGRQVLDGHSETFAISRQCSAKRIVASLVSHSPLFLRAPLQTSRNT
jgi:hypothetical protein